MRLHSATLRKSSPGHPMGCGDAVPSSRSVVARIVSGVAALALVTAPSPSAWAAPAENDEEAMPDEGPDAESVEGEPAEGETAEDQEGEEASADEGGEEAEETEEAEEPASEPAEPPPPTPVEPEIDRPDEPMINGKPRTGKGLMISGGVVLGVGIGTTIAFSLMTRGCKIDGPLQCRLQDQDAFLIPLGASTTLLGAMLLSVGVGYHLHYKRWQQWTPEQEKAKQNRRRGKRNKATAVFSPTFLPGGAGLGATGRF